MTASHQWLQTKYVKCSETCAGEAEQVAAMERDFLKSVLAVRKLEAEVRQAVQQVRLPCTVHSAGVLI